MGVEEMISAATTVIAMIDRHLVIWVQLVFVVVVLVNDDDFIANFICQDIIIIAI